MSAIELLTSATPNGQKISIFLEELGIAYSVTTVDLSKSEQKQPAFLAVNPNGRIPAIVDHSRDGFAVFESGAILLYLAEHYDSAHDFSFDAPDEKSEMLQWLFFQNAGLGPMQGQSNHFFRYAPEKIQYAIDRYLNETKRLYTVLEERLQNREYMVGRGKGRYSIVDISTFAWVRWAPWAGIALEEFPRLRAWAERIEGREAVKKGLLVPTGEDQIVRLRKDPNVNDPFKGWIIKGQNELKEEHGE